MILATTANYDANVDRMTSLWRSLDPEIVYRKLLSQFPGSPSRILDVGAGSCRDAAWLAAKGHSVTAIEPSDGLRSEAATMLSDGAFDLLDDALPYLPAMQERGAKFDTILCAAVFMHLTPEERSVAAHTFRDILADHDEARVILSFKLAPPEPERMMHVVDPDQLIMQFLAAGFRLVFRDQAEDELGRKDVTWHYLVFRPVN